MFFNPLTTGRARASAARSVALALICGQLAGCTIERAVQELKGEALPERAPVSLHLGVDIKIAESYLPEAADRLVVYKRLAQARTAEAVDRLQAETEDRYGHLPTSARSLFTMGRLRLIAEEAGVKSIDLVEDRVQIRFHERPPIEPQNVLELVARERGTLTPSGMVSLPAPPRGADRIESVVALLACSRNGYVCCPSPHRNHTVAEVSGQSQILLQHLTRPVQHALHHLATQLNPPLRHHTQHQRFYPR